MALPDALVFCPTPLCAMSNSANDGHSPDRDRITITVGAHGAQCTTTRAALCKTPSWFQSHSHSTSNIHLAEDDPVVVSTFLHWLQTSRLTSPDAPSPSPLGEMMLIDVFVFAQRYKIPALQDAVLTHLASSYERNTRSGRMAFLSRIVPSVYAKTHEHSRLREYVVEAAATDVSPDFFGEEEERGLMALPRQFALDVCYKSLCLLRAAQEGCSGGAKAGLCVAGVGRV